MGGDPNGSSLVFFTGAIIFFSMNMKCEWVLSEAKIANPTVLFMR